MFIENIDIQCSYCGNTFCEEIENDDTNSESHPSHFQPFRVNQNNNNNNQNNILSEFFLARNMQRPRTSGGLLDLVMSFLTGQRYQNDLESIINYIMLHDPNRYGNPPASAKEVEKLEKILITEEILKDLGIENSCAVCKEEFSVGENCLLMPCKHHFHGDCLLPWLKERNSCPVCRFELKTDDEDYEQRKRERNMRESNNNNNNVNQ